MLMVAPDGSMVFRCEGVLT